MISLRIPIIREGVELHRHRLDGRIVEGAVAEEAEEATPRVGHRKKARPSAYDDSLKESMMKEKRVVKSVRILVSASHRRSGSLYTTLPVAYCMGYRVRLITVPLKDASSSFWNDWSSSPKLVKLKESELTRGITITANERWMTTENKLHLCCAMAGRSQMEHRKCFCSASLGIRRQMTAEKNRQRKKSDINRDKVQLSDV
ncbi:hypothetical protein MUK42_13477 [Musa troglodytarum]|uniref:Uncharacterized protein n=1 Tax=Musa troglodytarum TaxID=320322 RepID=A0A9E7HSZ4_9LILI|nr:hypothetical protein MUK42_13477 [Musa troglodytarum]